MLGGDAPHPGADLGFRLGLGLVLKVENPLQVSLVVQAAIGERDDMIQTFWVSRRELPAGDGAAAVLLHENAQLDLQGDFCVVGRADPGGIFLMPPAL